MKTQKPTFTEQIGAITIVCLCAVALGVVFTAGNQLYAYFFFEEPIPLCPTDYHYSIVQNNNMRCVDVECDYYLMCVKD